MRTLFHSAEAPTHNADCRVCGVAGCPTRGPYERQKRGNICVTSELRTLSRLESRRYGRLENLRYDGGTPLPGLGIKPNGKPPNDPGQLRARAEARSGTAVEPAHSAGERDNRKADERVKARRRAG